MLVMKGRLPLFYIALKLACCKLKNLDRLHPKIAQLLQYLFDGLSFCKFFCNNIIMTSSSKPEPLGTLRCPFYVHNLCKLRLQ